MAFDERLIDQMRGKEYIYNKKHVDYKNNELKDREWNRIASNLGFPVERCKKRWGSLRDRYKRIRKHRSKSGSRKKWKHYDALSFIGLTMEPLSAEEAFDDDLITQDTYLEMGEELTSSPHQEPDQSKGNNDLTQYFSNFAEEAKNTASRKHTNDPAANTTHDATDEFFNYLAMRVKTANLDSMQEMRIEAAILNFTVEKLYEIQSEML